MSSLSGSDRVRIRVEDVSVTYRTSLERAPTLRSTLTRLGRRERVIKEIQALRNVSFEVGHGKVMGIVGANGAGKSTLMRTVAGILPPTSGRVEVHGRVITLLSLGVGFNRKLSGRENVVLGGTPWLITSLQAVSRPPSGLILRIGSYFGGTSLA